MQRIYATWSVMRIGLACAMLSLLTSCFDAPEAGKKAASACGVSGLTVISATQEQLKELCAAVREVRGFFASAGFKFEPEMKVVFRKNDPEPGRPPAHGTYDPIRREMILYAHDQSSPWGEPWSDVATSFLRHELAHVAVDRILSPDIWRLPVEWHEFIAYSMQLDLMAADMRARILERYDDTHAAGDLMQINGFTYGLAEPDRFAVFAYKTYRAYGGTDLVRRLLTFEYVPTPIERMLPFPPY